MSSVCKSAVGCVEDARVPVRATYVNLYKWPESDAEFARSVARGRRGGDEHSQSSNAYGRRRLGPGAPAVVDSYSCRQLYLRSYTFSKKESVPEKTVKCFGKVKERAVVCPFLHQRSSSSGSISSMGTAISEKNNENRKRKKKKKKKKKKKGCASKLKAVSCTALYAIFRRLLSCTASVDVMDGTPPS